MPNTQQDSKRGFVLHPHLTWRKIEDKHEMEQVLLHRNKQRFLDSIISPFATQPILNKMGLVGNSQGGEKMLNGTYSMDQEYQDPNKDILHRFIGQLRKFQFPVKVINPVITTHDFKQIFNSTRESTS